MKLTSVLAEARKSLHPQTAAAAVVPSVVLAVRKTESRKPLNEVIRREREQRVILHSLPRECYQLRPRKIEQGFIKEVRRQNQPHTDVRIRREGMGSYSLTAKHRPKFQECTTRITKEIFEAMWSKTHSRQRKERYKLESGWVVDLIKSENLIIAEYEFKPGETEVRIPRSFHVKEVLKELY